MDVYMNYCIWSTVHLEKSVHFMRKSYTPSILETELTGMYYHINPDICWVGLCCLTARPPTKMQRCVIAMEHQKQPTEVNDALDRLSILLFSHSSVLLFLPPF